MSLGYKEKKQIDNYIELIALSKVSRFYPTAISRQSSILPFEAFNYLLERSGPDKELILKWELQCPNWDCIKTIDIVNEIHLDELIECPRCNLEFEINATDFIPVFQINNDYKEYLATEQEIKKKRLELLST